MTENMFSTVHSSCATWWHYADVKVLEVLQRGTGGVAQAGPKGTDQLWVRSG